MGAFLLLSGDYPVGGRPIQGMAVEVGFMDQVDAGQVSDVARGVAGAMAGTPAIDADEVGFRRVRGLDLSPALSR